MTGVVEKLFYEEGQTVAEGTIIATIRDEVSPGQVAGNSYDTNQRRQFVRDLKMLTSYGGNTSFGSLSSALYKQQLNRYQYQLADQRASLKKVQRELENTNTLLADKVIAASEMQTQRALQWFQQQGKTIIIIAHRLSTIRNCDKILVMQNGTLVESGVHEELLLANNAYASLWKFHSGNTES